MTLSLLALLLAAAALHACWNLLLKRAPDRQLIVWWAVIASALCFVPVLLLRPAVPAIGWRFALASAVVETAYFVALTTAYRVADFSLVYPIARGAAPALLALAAVLLLHERLSPAGVAGLGAIVLGLWLVASVGPAGGAYHARGVALALLVALCIATYSTIDGAAVRRVDAASYTGAMFLLAALVFTPVTIRWYGWPALRGALRTRAALILLVGLLQAAAYLLVLYVYARAPVAYAGAIRESSIVLGALAGWLWLRESFGARRLAGALVTCAGIALIALAG
ncbi:MAG TPA: DMT family transporter [Gemmatimonadales bacterium]